MGFAVFDQLATFIFSVTRLISVRFRYRSTLASRSSDFSVAAAAVQVASCLMNNYMAHLIGFARSTRLSWRTEKAQKAQELKSPFAVQ